MTRPLAERLVFRNKGKGPSFQIATDKAHYQPRHTVQTKIKVKGPDGKPLKGFRLGVFVIGVIVSLVKIMAMATVVLGISFWAYTAFAICFTLAVSNLDRYQCWEDIEALGASRVPA